MGFRLGRRMVVASFIERRDIATGMVKVLTEVAERQLSVLVAHRRFDRFHQHRDGDYEVYTIHVDGLRLEKADT